MFKPIEIADFEERTGIKKREFAHIWDDAQKVVSLRDVVEVLGIQSMSMLYLERLILNTGLESDQRIKPYGCCKLVLLRMDPDNLFIGQTFVERKKCQSMLENFSSIFSKFCMTRGIAKRTACIILGRLADGSVGIAHYLPPIIEEQDGKYVLMDGIHRNFLIKTVGTTIETILIKGVAVPFPCETHSWDSVKLVMKNLPASRDFSIFAPNYLET